jgi:AhpD family alkylhydroperoxidase
MGDARSRSPARRQPALGHELRVGLGDRVARDAEVRGQRAGGRQASTCLQPPVPHGLPQGCLGRTADHADADTVGRRPWDPRLDFDGRAPLVARAMGGLDRAAREQAERSALDRRLVELVRLRASQLNGCAYCVDMHSKDAEAAGESSARLHALAAWPESPSFGDAERAALRLAESITRCADGHVPDEDWANAARQFDEDALAALVGVIVTINAWNHIGAATRAWMPGSYEP